MLSLELLKILLDNAGPVFRSSQRFVSAIKQYLCRSLLKNCGVAGGQIPATAAFNLSCAMFLALLKGFRSHLKAEIGIFVDIIFLKARFLDSSTDNVSLHRS